jgi:hypothetical protein
MIVSVAESRSRKSMATAMSEPKLIFDMDGFLKM